MDSSRDRTAPSIGLRVRTPPCLLGSGIRLFGDLRKDIDLRLLSSKAFAFGFVQSHYAVLTTA